MSCLQSDSENVNLNCFLSMRSVLLDTKIVAEGGHRYLLLSPFAHHHVLEPVSECRVLSLPSL